MTQKDPLPVVLLMGPTASGKSGLAMALAQRLPVEIVSVDSAQVYRGMDIGTAKPSAAERAAVPHYLLDILDPAQSYSAARFREDALRLIDEIRGRGRIPLLVGGTMLYFRALLNGLSDLPSANPEMRLRLSAEAAHLGWPAMHARLAQLDPATAERLSPNDKQRIQRALEIIESSGVQASELYRAQPAKEGPTGSLFKLALNPPERAELHRRIESRLLQMVDRGFLQEVAALHARGDLHPDLPSMRCVGYRQFWQHVDGAWSLQEALQRALYASRQLAKRQLTWLRSETQVNWMDPAAVDLDTRALDLLRPSLPEGIC
jgi:tRNA dimethylallyltransferase